MRNMVYVKKSPATGNWCVMRIRWDGTPFIIWRNRAWERAYNYADKEARKS